MGMVSVAVELATGMPESWQRRQVGGNKNEYGIDLLTHVGALCEAVPREAAHARKRPREASGTRAGADASSGAGPGARRPVLEAPGLLRRLRRTPGQVRDVARPLSGRPAGDDRLRGVRLQSPDLLPVARSVGAPRAYRPARCTSRSGWPPHLHTSGGRLSPCSARRRADVVDPGLAGPPRTHARGPSASADRGASPARWSTKKKNAAER